MVFDRVVCFLSLWLRVTKLHVTILRHCLAKCICSLLLQDEEESKESNSASVVAIVA